MNFLAHLFLADDNAEAMIGALMPDLVRPRNLPADLPPATRKAIEQHRAIDLFTDTHPVVARSKDRLRPSHGRYAGILVDVLYDHFLSADWERYSAEPLAVFRGRVHEAFASHAHLLPPSMRYPLDRLVAEDWLAAYASVEGIRMVLGRMSRRLSQRFDRPVDLASAADALVTQRAGLGGDFTEFFPQLMAWVGKTPPHPPRQGFGWEDSAG